MTGVQTCALPISRSYAILAVLAVACVDSGRVVESNSPSLAVQQLASSPATLARLGCLIASRGTNGGTRVIHVPSAVKLRLTERVRTSRIVLREVLRSSSSATYCFSADETLPTLTERLQRSLRGSETAVRELNVPYDFLRANNAADVLAHEWLRSVAPAYYRTRGSSLIRSGAVRPASFQSGDTTNVQKTPLAPVYVTATVDPVTKQSWVHISDSEARWKLKGQAPSSMFDPDYMVVWDGIDDCLIAADLGLWQLDEANRLDEVAAAEERTVSSLEQQHQAFCKLEVGRAYPMAPTSAPRSVQTRRSARGHPRVLTRRSREL